MVHAQPPQILQTHSPTRPLAHPLAHSYSSTPTRPLQQPAIFFEEGRWRWLWGDWDDCDGSRMKELSQTLVRRQRQKPEEREKEKTRHSMHRFFACRLWALTLLLPLHDLILAGVFLLRSYLLFFYIPFILPHTAHPKKSSFGLRPSPCTHHGYKPSSPDECLKSLHK